MDTAYVRENPPQYSLIRLSTSILGTWNVWWFLPGGFFCMVLQGISPPVQNWGCRLWRTVGPGMNMQLLIEQTNSNGKWSSWGGGDTSWLLDVSDGSLTKDEHLHSGAPKPPSTLPHPQLHENAVELPSGEVLARVPANKCCWAAFGWSPG